MPFRSSLTSPSRLRRASALVAVAAMAVGGSALAGGTASAAGSVASKHFVDPKVAQPQPDAKVADQADSVVQLLKQPSGYKFPARMDDLELGGLFETTDGYGVERDASGTWRYITGRNGQNHLMLGAVVTAKGAPAGLAKHLGRQKVHLSAGELDEREAIAKGLTAMSKQLAPMAKGSSAVAPRVFHVPALMLATWYDEKAGETAPQFHAPTNTPAYFKKLLDGFGGSPLGTVTQYYYESSFGQFLVQIDVYGTYTSAHSVGDPCYYGTPDAGSVDVQDPVGGELGLGGLGGVGMAIEAVPQAVNVPWAKYDNNHDGVVDFTMIIHSGGGHEVTGDKCNTHSHQISVSSLANIATGAAGINAETLHVGLPTDTPGESVDRILTIPEYESKDSPLTIGVAAHEMAHALGEPDYYDTSYSSVGTGDYDIMSGGSYLGNPSGSNPAMQNPATRVFQHYLTPTIVHKSLRHYTIKPRTALPFKGYHYGLPDPNLLLVPTYERAIGEKDSLGHVWTADDCYGLAYDKKTKKYVVEGFYVENVSRNATSPKIHAGNPMGSMFDRQQHASGLAVWHFDYWRQSTTYFGGANDAQNDPNRYQMDLEEFDQNDNTQELQLNYARGNPSDLLTAAATGITSGTTMLPPGAKSAAKGNPQKPVQLAGTSTPVSAGTQKFTVSKTAVNAAMDVSVKSDLAGDCKLQLTDPTGHAGTVTDSGGPGEAETQSVKTPMPGTWTVTVGDYAACGSWSGSVVFDGGAKGSFNTLGAADTRSNWSKAPTGWAFTNVRGYGNGLDESQEGGAKASTNMTLDILNLRKAKDVSPGFVTGRLDKLGGSTDLTAGKKNTLEVPVFSNGGKAPGKVTVQIRAGAGKTAKVVATKQVKLGRYQRKYVRFTYKPAAEGPVVLSVAVDPRNKVHEGDESNQVQVTNLWSGPRHPKVLVVDDDQTLTGERTIEGALAALGVPYAVYQAHPSAAVLRKYKAVFWEAGVDRYEGQLAQADRLAIQSYLDHGGRLMIDSNRIMDGLTTVGSPQTPSSVPAFGAHYFGVRTPYGNTSYVVSQSRMATVTGHGLLNKQIVRILPSAARQFVGLAGLSSSGNGATNAKILPYGKASGIGSLSADALKAVTPSGDAPYIGVAVDGDKAHHGFRTVTLGWNLGQDISTYATEQVMTKVLHHFGVHTGPALKPAQRLVYLTAPRDSVSGRAIPVTAIVLGGHGRAKPVLYYRSHGRGKFYSVRMRLFRGSHTAYRAVLPKPVVTPAGVDYYVKAGSTLAPYGATGGRLYYSLTVAIPNVKHPLKIKR